MKDLAEIFEEQNNKIESLEQRFNDLLKKFEKLDLPNKEELSRTIEDYVAAITAQRRAAQMETIEMELRKLAFDGKIPDKAPRHIMRILRGEVPGIIESGARATAEQIDDLSLVEKGRKDWDRIE